MILMRVVACHLNTEHEFPFELIGGGEKLGFGEWTKGWENRTMQINMDIHIDVHVPVIVILLFRLHDSDHYLLFLN